MNYICLDGKMIPQDQPALMADNRGFRYGDGVFETIRVLKGAVPLFPQHMDRFFNSLALLGYQLQETNTAEQFYNEIMSLCDKNGSPLNARVRLTAFRGNGGLTQFNDTLHYLLESTPLPEPELTLNEVGLTAGIYRPAIKNIDEFSNLKSANFLPYLMAARHAKYQGWNDAFLLNAHQRLADATIANVFIIKDKQIFTPPLSEGPVSGVMRNWLLINLLEAGYSVGEKAVTLADLHEADEVFLTNAIFGIRWVSNISDRIYGSTQAREIYKLLVEQFGLNLVLMA